MDQVEEFANPSDLLKSKWELYIRVTPTNFKEKHQHLEEFLHLFLCTAASARYSCENIRDFSNDTGSVCNILAREFLSDVHSCCTSQECSDGDTSLLMNYLLHNRGWLLLHALNELINQVCTLSLNFTYEIPKIWACYHCVCEFYYHCFYVL
ncbi:uncharacterized protein LOC144357808 [Saccoglossus kowalevskii]